MKELKIITAMMIMFGMIGYSGELKNAIKLKLTKSSTYDETLIRYVDGASESYDTRYDALKIHAVNFSQPAIYSKTTEGSMLSISSLPFEAQQKGLEFFIKPSKAGLHKIEASVVGEIQNLEGLHLTDLNNNPIEQLDEGYAFMVKEDMVGHEQGFKLELLLGTEHNSENILAANNKVAEDMEDVEVAQAEVEIDAFQDDNNMLYVSINQTSGYGRSVLLVVENENGETFYSKVVQCSEATTIEVIDPSNQIPPGTYSVVGSGNDKEFGSKQVTVKW